MTIYDVALRAGVGIATVSRAINDSPNILPETKARVLKAISDLNYKPHALARGLAGKKSSIITAILPDLASHFYFGVLSGIQREALQNNYDLMLYSSEQTERLPEYLEEIIRDRRSGHVILISQKLPNSFIEKHVSTDLSIILVDNYHPKVDSIITDNEKGAYQATKHLADLGHKNIGFIVGALHSLPAQQRFKGFRKALEDHDIALKKPNMIECSFHSMNDGFSEFAGYTAMKKLIELGSKMPTAVFLSCDVQAIGAFKALSEKNIKVPDEISLVGFDDIELADYLGLTTIRQPIIDMGCMAVQRLLEKSNGTNQGIFRKVLDTELIIRNTTATYKM